MDSKTFVVPNISCEHCVHTIQNEVSEVKGVKAVKADQQTKEVTVQWEAPATWSEIEKLLTEIDYPPQRN
jgi:copper chaperone CopZ